MQMVQMDEQPGQSSRKAASSLISHTHKSNHAHTHRSGRPKACWEHRLACQPFTHPKSPLRKLIPPTVRTKTNHMLFAAQNSIRALNIYRCKCVAMNFSLLFNNSDVGKVLTRVIFFSFHQSQSSAACLAVAETHQCLPNQQLDAVNNAKYNRRLPFLSRTLLMKSGR